MENREAINKDGSLFDRMVISDNIKQHHKRKILDSIVALELELLDHAKTVGQLKQEGLSYQWHENKCNALKVELDKQTKEFLENY